MKSKKFTGSLIIAISTVVIGLLPNDAYAGRQCLWKLCSWKLPPTVTTKLSVNPNQEYLISFRAVNYTSFEVKETGRSLINTNNSPQNWIKK